jgi:signal transduction histidine kinase
VSKDQKVIWVMMRAHNMLKNPSVKGIAVYFTDITQRKTAEIELHQSKERLRNSLEEVRRLSEHLQNIREEERAHIAREIHDELGQKLTVLKMDISWINKKIGLKEESVKARMEELIAMLDETVGSVRRISSDLRPSLLDDLGLTAAMEWQLNEFEKRFEIKTCFKSHDDAIKLTESVKIGLFRIFQESLTNVARHSRAKKVTVALNRKNDSIVLSIADDGTGFDKQSADNNKTLGLLGMKERTAMIGGTFEINGKPGKGTKVVVTIQLEESIKN